MKCLLSFTEIRLRKRFRVDSFCLKEFWREMRWKGYSAVNAIFHVASNLFDVVIILWPPLSSWHFLFFRCEEAAAMPKGHSLYFDTTLSKFQRPARHTHATATTRRRLFVQIVNLNTYQVHQSFGSSSTVCRLSAHESKKVKCRSWFFHSTKYTRIAITILSSSWLTLWRMVFFPIQWFFHAYFVSHRISREYKGNDGCAVRQKPRNCMRAFRFSGFGAETVLVQCLEVHVWSIHTYTMNPLWMSWPRYAHHT